MESSRQKALRTNDKTAVYVPKTPINHGGIEYNMRDKFPFVADNEYNFNKCEKRGVHSYNCQCPTTSNQENTVNKKEFDETRAEIKNDDKDRQLEEANELVAFHYENDFKSRDENEKLKKYYDKYLKPVDEHFEKFHFRYEECTKCEKLGGKG